MIGTENYFLSGGRAIDARKEGSSAAGFQIFQIDP